MFIEAHRTAPEIICATPPKTRGGGAGAQPREGEFWQHSKQGKILQLNGFRLQKPPRLHPDSTLRRASQIAHRGRRSDSKKGPGRIAHRKLNANLTFCLHLNTLSTILLTNLFPSPCLLPLRIQSLNYFLNSTLRRFGLLNVFSLQFNRNIIAGSTILTILLF